MKGNSRWLLAGGLIATALAAGGVIFGRVQRVDPPRACAPEVVPLLCDRPGPGGERVDRVELAAAVRELRAHGHALRVLPPTDSCTPGDGVIDLVIDPALDDQRIAVDGPQPLPDRLEDPYEGALPLSPITWGRTEQRCEGPRWRGASVRLHPRAGQLALVHEALHALGWVPDHDVWHPPTGHVLHAHRPSLDDWRGVDGGAR